jgi:hypothetical protein
MDLREWTDENGNVPMNDFWEEVEIRCPKVGGRLRKHLDLVRKYTFPELLRSGFVRPLGGETLLFEIKLNTCGYYPRIFFTVVGGVTAWLLFGILKNRPEKVHQHVIERARRMGKQVRSQ